MSLFDMAVSLVIGVCLILSLLKGMVKEIFSLVAYGAGYFSAYGYKDEAAVYIKNYVNNPMGAKVLAFFVLFIGVSIIVKLIGGFIQKLMYETGDLTFLDRALGALLGVAKGVFIVAVILIPIEIFPKVDQEIITGSVSAPYFKQVSSYLKQSMFSNGNIMKKTNKLGLDKIQKPLNDIKQYQELQKRLPTPKIYSSEKALPQDNHSNASKKALQELLQTIQQQ